MLIRRFQWPVLFASGAVRRIGGEADRMGPSSANDEEDARTQATNEAEPDTAHGGREAIVGSFGRLIV